MENCKLSEDGKKVIVNEDKDNACITIKGGILAESRFLIHIGEVTEEKLTYRFLKYELVDEDDITYVTKVQPNTTVDQIKTAIETNGEISIQADDESNSLLATGNVATGNKIVITKGEERKEFAIVVKGDTNGDAKADFKDILKINRHRLGKQALTEAFLKAGDVNEDAKADFKDILKVNRYRLGKITEL